MSSQLAINLRHREGLTLNLTPRPSMSVSSSPLSPVSSNTPTTTTSRSSKRISQTTPLPEYSPHLPPIDRTKTSKAFYEDLLGKQIIHGLDDKSWTCWCHVAKRDQVPPARNLSLSHCKVSASRGAQQYISFLWFAHAARCAFYKVSPSLYHTPVTDPPIESVGYETRKWNGRAVVSTVPVTEAIDNTSDGKSAGTVAKGNQEVQTVNDGEDQAPDSTEHEKWGENLFWRY